MKINIEFEEQEQPKEVQFEECEKSTDIQFDNVVKTGLGGRKRPYCSRLGEAT